MRILQVTIGFYPAQTWGGPVKIVHENSKELIRRGHEITVYCTNLLNKKEKIQPGTFEKNIDGIRVVYLDTINIPWWPGTLGPMWLPDLPKQLKREITSFDIVHLNGYRSPIMLVSARAARKAGIPIVNQLHGSMADIMHSYYFKRIYDRVFGKYELNEISALIALQETEQAQALRYGVPTNRIVIIPNGIDESALQEIQIKGAFRNKYNIQSHLKVILFMGRLNRTKGADLLVEAYAEMDDPNSCLVIAGPDDGQLDEIRQLVCEKKLNSRVIITGLLTGQEVKSAFLDTDIFVLPSRLDAFPTTIMEACLMGTPMVITDRCGSADLVKDRIAEVVPADVHALANGMKRLLNDQELYDRYKANCKDVLKDTFSIQHTVDLLEGIYQKVLAEKVQ